MIFRGLAFGLFVVAGLTVPIHAQSAAPGASLASKLAPTGLSARTAQALTRAASSKISVEGCVERAQRNGSVGGTGLGTTSSPNTAGRDANSSEILDVFQLSSAQPIPGDANTERTSYALEGHEQELGGHTGHRVQITGMLAPPRVAATSTDAATAAGIRRIRVDAIKMISASCGKSVK